MPPLPLSSATSSAAYLIFGLHSDFGFLESKFGTRDWEFGAWDSAIVGIGFRVWNIGLMVPRSNSLMAQAMPALGHPAFGIHSFLGDGAYPS